MAESEDLGKIINERRLALGYSLGQLANRVGATPSQVREWEKSGGIPDADTIPKLGSVLGVEPGRLAAAKPGRRVAPPPPAAPAQRKSESDQNDGAGSRAAAAAAAGAAVTGRPPVDEPTSMIGASSGPPPGVPSPVAPVFSDASATGDLDASLRMEDMPTEAVEVVPPPPSKAAASAPAMAPVPASVATATRQPAASWPDATPDTTRRDGIFGPLNQFVSTVLDPNRRYLFWLRVGLTIVVLLVFAVILSRLVPAFFDSLKDILDTIETTTDDPSVTSTTLPAG